VHVKRFLTFLLLGTDAARSAREEIDDPMKDAKVARAAALLGEPVLAGSVVAPGGRWKAMRSAGIALTTRVLIFEIGVAAGVVAEIVADHIAQAATDAAGAVAEEAMSQGLETVSEHAGEGIVNAIGRTAGAYRPPPGQTFWTDYLYIAVCESKVGFFSVKGTWTHGIDTLLLTVPRFSLTSFEISREGWIASPLTIGIQDRASFDLEVPKLFAGKAREVKRTLGV